MTILQKIDKIIRPYKYEFNPHVKPIYKIRVKNEAYILYIPNLIYSSAYLTVDTIKDITYLKTEIIEMHVKTKEYMMLRLKTNEFIPKIHRNFTLDYDVQNHIAIMDVVMVNQIKKQYHCLIKQTIMGNIFFVTDKKIVKKIIQEYLQQIKNIIYKEIKQNEKIYSESKMIKDFKKYSHNTLHQLAII